MAIRKVARLGHPVLRQKARKVKREEIGTPELERLVEDMVETMAEYGGIGLAAPQVHESLSLAIIGFDDDSDRYPGMGDQPLGVFINPKVTPLTKETQTYWEGCLSVPGMRGRVTRPKKVRIDYWDLEGKEKSLEAEGFLATVFQHELDHLEGVVYIDRVATSLGETKFAFDDEYEKYILPEMADDEGELKD